MAIPVLHISILYYHSLTTHFSLRACMKIENFSHLFLAANWTVLYEIRERQKQSSLLNKLLEISDKTLQFITTTT